MRALTAIVAAVMSVTTGGPLRCPCRLAELLRPAPPAVACDDAPARRTCPCHRHAEPGDSRPRAPERVPVRAPCPHSPALDLLPAPAHMDRGDCPAGGEGVVPREQPALRVLTAGVAATSAAPPTHPPPGDHLRYSHAFRC